MELIKQHIIRKHTKVKKLGKPTDFTKLIEVYITYLIYVRAD